MLIAIAGKEESGSLLEYLWINGVLWFKLQVYHDNGYDHTTTAATHGRMLTCVCSNGSHESTLMRELQW